VSKLVHKILEIIAIDESHAAFIKKGISGSLAMEIGAKVMLFVITLILTNSL